MQKKLNRIVANSRIKYAALKSLHLKASCLLHCKLRAQIKKNLNKKVNLIMYEHFLLLQFTEVMFTFSKSGLEPKQGQRGFGLLSFNGTWACEVIKVAGSYVT